MLQQILIDEPPSVYIPRRFITIVGLLKNIAIILIFSVIIAEDCYPPGDANGDAELDVIDIVVTVNSALDPGFSECSDINYDGDINVLDIVQMVNVILNPPTCLHPNFTPIPEGNPLIAENESFAGWDPSVIFDEESGLYKVWHTIYRNQILGIGYGESWPAPQKLYQVFICG